MSNDGASKDDVKVPEGDLGKQIESDFEEGKDLLVTIISAMGEEQVSISPISRFCARISHLLTLFSFFPIGHFRQGSS